MQKLTPIEGAKQIKSQVALQKCWFKRDKLHRVWQNVEFSRCSMILLHANLGFLFPLVCPSVAFPLRTVQAEILRDRLRSVTGMRSKDISSAVWLLKKPKQCNLAPNLLKFLHTAETLIGAFWGVTDRGPALKKQFVEIQTQNKYLDSSLYCL